MLNFFTHKDKKSYSVNYIWLCVKFLSFFSFSSFISSTWMVNSSWIFAGWCSVVSKFDWISKWCFGTHLSNTDFWFAFHKCSGIWVILFSPSLSLSFDNQFIDLTYYITSTEKRFILSTYKPYKKHLKGNKGKE